VAKVVGDIEYKKQKSQCPPLVHPLNNKK